MASLPQSHATPAAMARMLWPKWYRPRRQRARVADIVAIAADMIGVTVTELTGAGRGADLIQARFAACLVACEHGHSLPVIGRRINRDHTTVWHARGMAKQRTQRDPIFALFVSDLRFAAASAKPFIADRLSA